MSLLKYNYVVYLFSVVYYFIKKWEYNQLDRLTQIVTKPIGVIFIINLLGTYVIVNTICHNNLDLSKGINISKLTLIFLTLLVVGEFIINYFRSFAIISSFSAIKSYVNMLISDVSFVKWSTSKVIDFSKKHRVGHKKIISLVIAHLQRYINGTFIVPLTVLLTNLTINRYHLIRFCIYEYIYLLMMYFIAYVFKHHYKMVNGEYNALLNKQRCKSVPLKFNNEAFDYLYRKYKPSYVKNEINSNKCINFPIITITYIIIMELAALINDDIDLMDELNIVRAIDQKYRGSIQEDLLEIYKNKDHNKYETDINVLYKISLKIRKLYVKKTK